MTQEYLLLRLQGKRISRFNDPDLMAKACQYGMEKGCRHFFCGGKERVALLLRDKLTQRFPGLITAGTYSPPFHQLSPDADAAVIDEINKLNPDILWVGLGLLKQERWIAEHLGKINVPWMIGIGAAFDFHAGTARRAPGFLRSIGLEWLYRLAFEPRMLKRNFYSFPFLFLVAREAMHQRKK